MKMIRKVCLFGSVMLLYSTLLGCASMHAQKQRKIACLHAPLLYANLAQAPQYRVYQLENGADCTRYYRDGDLS